MMSSWSKSVRLDSLLMKSLFSTDFTNRELLSEVWIRFCAEKPLSQGTEVMGMVSEMCARVQNSGNMSAHLHLPGIT